MVYERQLSVPLKLYKCFMYLGFTEAHTPRTPRQNVTAISVNAAREFGRDAKRKETRGGTIPSV